MGCLFLQQLFLCVCRALRGCWMQLLCTSIVETGHEKVPCLATQPSSLVNPATDPSHPFCCDWLHARCIPWIQWERDERKSLLHAETLLRVWDHKGKTLRDEHWWVWLQDWGWFLQRAFHHQLWSKAGSCFATLNAAALHNHVFADKKGEYISDPLLFPLGHLPSPVKQQSMGKGHAIALPCVFSLRRRAKLHPCSRTVQAGQC